MNINISDQDAALREAVRMHWINKMAAIKEARLVRGEHHTNEMYLAALAAGGE